MHPEADAFLDAIFDHPDDDTARLVYADWLQEHGQENYAQFIRLQCAAARENLWSDEANRLWEEIGRVWHRLDDEWWPATRDSWWSSTSYGRLDAIHFVRGLLRPDVAVHVEQIQEFSAYCAWLPSCEVRLLYVSDLEKLASMPVARRLRKVVLNRGAAQGIPVEERDCCLTSFARSEFTRKVRILDLSEIYLTRMMVQTLLREKSFPGLEELHVAFIDDQSDYNPSETMRQLQARYKKVVRH